MLIAIWAQDEKGLIGKESGLPWHLPNDLQFFKQQTLDHPIVMGRKTFQGMGFKSLPQRENIILTRDKNQFAGKQFADNVVFTDSLADIVARSENEDIYITGGKEIFQMFWPYLAELRVTKIAGQFEGDTYFTPDLADFEMYHQETGTVDEKNAFPHTFNFYRRK